MSRSYEHVNYALRPAKNIERKMIIEAMRRLSHIASLHSYRYIGMGSTSFSDFVIVHKVLGVISMVSIEKDSDKSERFAFNKPFDCIDLRFGRASDILPVLPWTQRSIVWLDYDDPMSSEILSDLSLVCSQAPSGSVVIVSVNVHHESDEDSRLDSFKTLVGAENVPTDVTSGDLNKSGLPRTCRRILHGHMSAAVGDRNGLLAPGNKMLYEQLFHFLYSDRAPMLTVGGIIYDESIRTQIGACDFGNPDSLSFLRSGEAPFNIRVPILTVRELRHINAQLPCDDVGKVKAAGISTSDLQDYCKLYRWFPMFSESEP